MKIMGDVWPDSSESANELLSGRVKVMMNERQQSKRQNTTSNLLSLQIEQRL